MNDMAAGSTELPENRVRYHDRSILLPPMMADFACCIVRTSLVATMLFLLPALASPGLHLHAQTVVSRKVIGGGGGTTSSSGHTVQGTISQTAAGRLGHGAGERHDAGFWYWAYPPDNIVKVWLPAIEAEPGTRVKIPLHLTLLPSHTPFLPRPFHARIGFNHTLLRPAGNTPTCSFSGDTCAIEIDGVATTADGVIAELEFVVTLGDTESTALTIEQFVWGDVGPRERIATARENGELRLLGVCRVGGALRLIRSGSFASHLRVWPNPAGAHATLEYVSAETGPLTVRIVDLLGNSVTKLVSADAEAQRLYSTEIDLTAIPSGAYVVVCSTPSQVLTQSLLITQ